MASRSAGDSVRRVPETNPTSPPTPRRDPVTRERHGRTAVDEYAWMRDDERTDADVVAHLEAENAHTAAVLEPTKDLQEAIFAEIKGRGFDVKAIRVILRERKQDPDAVAEQEAVVDLYKAALGMK